MHRRINFLSIAVLLSFATLFSVAIHAQDKLRLSRPAQNSIQTDQSTNNAIDNPQNNFNGDNPSSFRLNLPPKNNFVKGTVEEESRSGSLAQVQLHKLAAHDIILLIDKSGSMSTPDCPTGHSGLKSELASLAFGGSFEASRWQWCRQQITQMSDQIQQVLPEGFTVLLFDSGTYLFPHVNAGNLVRIFASNNPGGGTILTLPLNQVFNDYFKRKKISRVKIKPLLIGIITDGCPNDPHDVKKLLVDVTHTLQDPQEVTIIFFLIGRHDSQGEKFAHDMSQNLIKAGASFNIVKYVPFNEVQRTGLVQSLADNLE